MDGETKKFNNPITFSGENAFIELLQAILNVIIILATPIIVLFIIYAGFQYVTARGNPEKLRVANQAIVYAVIGGVVILGSVVIIEIIRNVVGAF